MTAGLAIYDTIQYVKSEVVTICVGLAASMGAFLLAAGTKGKRVALPHSRIMIHQPLGGTSRRQASDIEIEARETAGTEAVGGGGEQGEVQQEAEDGPPAQLLVVQHGALKGHAEHLQRDRVPHGCEQDQGKKPHVHLPETLGDRAH